MKTFLSCLIVGLCLVSPAMGVVASEHCSGACASTAVANAQQCWDVVVHEAHETNNSTGNCGDDGTGQVCGSGYGDRTWLNGSSINWVCSGSTCSYEVNLRCGNRTWTQRNGCATGSGNAALTADSNGVSCFGSPGSSSACSCVGGTPYCANF